MVNGLKEGKWIEYWDYNHYVTDTNKGYEIYILTIYKKGKPYGIVREYYKCGKIEREIPYVNGVEKWYSENGYEWGEYPTINGKRDGIAKEYFKGMLTKEAPFNNGKLNGVVKEYIESDKVIKETPYSNDDKNGIEKWYYENGKVFKVVPYKNGVKDGIEIVYGEKGEIESKHSFKRGCEYGTGIDYYYNGKIMYEVPYIIDSTVGSFRSEINGIKKTYYESGELNFEMPFTKGNLNGEVKEYYKNGKLKSETNYKNGVFGIQGKTKHYDEIGNEIK